MKSMRFGCCALLLACVSHIYGSKIGTTDMIQQHRQQRDIICCVTPQGTSIKCCEGTSQNHCRKHPGMPDVVTIDLDEECEDDQCTENESGIIMMYQGGRGMHTTCYHTLTNYNDIRVKVTSDSGYTKCNSVTRDIADNRTQSTNILSQTTIDFNRGNVENIDIYLLSPLPDAPMTPTITRNDEMMSTTPLVPSSSPITNVTASTTAMSTETNLRPGRGKGAKNKHFIRTIVASVVVALVVILLLLNLAANLYRKWNRSPPVYQNQPGTTNEQRGCREVISSSSTPVTLGFPGGELNGRHDGNLTSLQASTSHEMRVYDEVFEEDDHVLLRDKEKVDYHEYTMIPENGQSKLQKGGVPTNGIGHYQELLKESMCQEDGERKSPGANNASGASGHSLSAVDAEQEQIERSTIPGHVYQALRKDGQNATSNHQADGLIQNHQRAKDLILTRQ